MDRTLVICKPDAVERGLVGEIVARLERRTLRIVAAELRTIDEATAGRHYAEHEGKPFYADLVAFITRGPAMILVVEGPEDTWKVVRTMMGATNPREAAPGLAGTGNLHGAPIIAAQFSPPANALVHLDQLGLNGCGDHL